MNLKDKFKAISKYSECRISNWFNAYAGSLAGCQHMSHIALHISFCNFDDKSIKAEYLVKSVKGKVKKIKEKTYKCWFSLYTFVPPCKNKTKTLFFSHMSPCKTKCFPFFPHVRQLFPHVRYISFPSFF